MDTNIKIITTVDRPHLAYQFIKILHDHDVEVLKMEVYSAIIYFKIPKLEEELFNKIMEQFNEIEELDNVEIVPLMASESTDIIVSQSLDIIPQPIIIIGPEQRILYTNKYAKEKLFEGENNIGHYIYDHMEDISPELFKDFETGSSINFTSRLNEMTTTIQQILSEDDQLVGYLISMSINYMILDIHRPISFEDLITENEEMKNVVDLAKLYSQTDLPLLLRGGEGTGKERFARAIHNESKRSDKPFMSINCSDTPSQLFESELFGYEPNAIEGGNKNGQKGILELANGGTVFMNKINDLSILSQIKLLEVLNTGYIKRLGSDESIKINIRFIFSTNMDIENLITKKKFRIDLYFKISNLLLNIPLLKDRKDDIRPLVENYLNEKRSSFDTENYTLTDTAYEALSEYDWPGNIRELFNVIDRAVATSQDLTINRELILLSIYGAEEWDISTNHSLKESVETFEREIIVEELKKNPSIRKTAKKLDVPHTLLLRRIEKYGITDEEWR